MRSSTASVTGTPQNGIPMHPIFYSVANYEYFQVIIATSYFLISTIFILDC